MIIIIIIRILVKPGTEKRQYLFSRPRQVRYKKNMLKDECYALVTGASGGLGREFAAALARAGKPLALVGRSAERLDAAIAGLPGSGKKVAIAEDLSKPGAAGRLFAACAERGLTVDMLINNAGSGLFGQSARLDPAAVDAMIQLNVSALTGLCSLFGAPMAAKGAGSILNVGSFVGLNATPYFASYAATKSYVLSYSLALREELKGSGVAVTCLLPGYIRTNFDGAAGADGAAYRRFSDANAMDAEAVAKVGLAALSRKRPFAIAGARNRLMAAVFGLMPRTAPPAIMKKFIEALV